MRRTTLMTVLALLVGLCLPALALAAGGGGAADLVVVADTRVIGSGILKYFADLYNFNPLLFAVWAVILTTAYGCFLGVLMDVIMSRTGLNLRSRKIIEQ
jgi:hypothetical protein